MNSEVMEFKEFLVDEEIPTTSPAIKEKKGRFEILTAKDLLQQQEPIAWTVNGLISNGSLNVWFGEGGCGKTWALLDLALCVATGKPWLGMETTQSPVLLIDEESGQRRLSRRMGDIFRGHDASEDTPLMAVSLASFDLGKPNDIGELTNLINKTVARLVIIDALADVMPGRDENAVKDTMPIFQALRKIVEDTKAAIIVIHHSNKTGGYRGSSAIKGAIDLLLSVEKKNNDSRMIFKTDKARDTTAGTFAADANFIPGKFWLSLADVEAVQISYSAAERFVLEYLAKNKASQIVTISDNVEGCSEAAARNAVYSLARKKLAKRVDSGTKGAKATYDLTDEGMTVAGNL